jgi:hypothetical protein
VSYRMEMRALACASDNALAETFTRKNPVISGYGTGYGKGKGHRAEPNIQVAPTRRAAEASLHTQTVRAQIDNETRSCVG